MSQHIQTYLDSIISEHNSGRAREHTYRPALKALLESINENIKAHNEPSRESCGAPDFIIMDSKNIPRWYIEAKDITANILDDKKNQAQIAKYFDGELGYNFIHTDNIEFRFYRNAELVETVKIAELENGKIIPKSEKFEKLEMLLENFLSFKTQTITSSKKLSEIMAGKARMIKRVIYMTLLNNKDVQTEVHNQFKVFKDVLVHDLDETSFADIYAQTIVYGLFTARLHDPTLPTFDRDEAARLLPKSNPFLKKFFQSLRDDLDPRIEWIVDDLVEVFLASDVKSLLVDYGKTTARNDPIIHFYEDFLSMYDQKLRKAKWVYYTPEPVVDFIIRWVDDILKSEFGLDDGLADTSKTEIEIDTQEVKRGKIVKAKRQVHKVQVLDPATWTGTFLNAIVKYIHETRFSGMTGIWNSYVTDNLIPRLHGFEYMMASYAMAHLKLDLTLTETGYKQDDKNPQRLWIYLTNSLEEEHADTGTIFQNYLAQESIEANHIKRDTPVMCIVGNPPYSGISQNNSAWIQGLLEDYKKEPGGKIKLQERKHWLNDDYVKFIRLAQNLIEKNNEWVLAYICPHWFLDNPTFRWMRWNLLSNFDKIYTIDLHGNSKKKEVCPDGSVDQNVFDIQQWVAITFFIKTNQKKKSELAQLYHCDVYWKRDAKYNWLQENTFDSTKFKLLQNKAPNYFFVPKDFELESKYEKWFSVAEIFPVNSTWIVTAMDKLSIFQSKEELEKVTDDILSCENPYEKYGIKDTRRTSKENRLVELREAQQRWPIPISYRPFDTWYMYYTTKNEHWINSPRKEVMQHLINKENIAFATARSNKSETCDHFFITKNISETKFAERTIQSAIFPLYLYNQNQDNLLDEDAPERTANFDMEIITKIEKKLGMKLDADFTPEDLLDYIYAVLHSKSYRETYKEFLKIDFPRVPFEVTKEIFFEMVKLGRELRSWHLLENEKLTAQNFITSYPEDGDNLVEKIKFVENKVFINDIQYFEGVPENVWEFYIGWYQPAQKWLKDRKGRNLEYEDIIHYGKIILTLSETIRVMQEIENVFNV